VEVKKEVSGEKLAAARIPHQEILKDLDLTGQIDKEKVSPERKRRALVTLRKISRMLKRHHRKSKSNKNKYS